jgi:ATP-dependent protease ClpP protease subunit
VSKKKEKSDSQSITWESVRLELNSTRTKQGEIDYDSVRCRKLEALAAHTKRPAVLYATDFLNESKTKLVQSAVALDQQDVRGLAEVVRGLEGDAVDLILHSPGGSPEAADSIVSVLRSQFKTVRVLVPVMAKSAATMIALSANEILMPRSAELGPIDPQFILNDGRGGQRITPAQAIIDEVQKALQAVTNQQADQNVWLMQVQRQPPGLYQQALNAVQLSKQLVQGWLQQYMFAGDANAQTLCRRRSGTASSLWRTYSMAG